MIIEASHSALTFAAGYLAGAADRRFGTGTQWTMAVYMRMQRKGPVTAADLDRLERAIARRWPAGEDPPRLADVFR